MSIKPKIAIVGAGIFGCTTAIKLAELGFEVEIFEKNKDIMCGASGINQYRLHRGYHYPRSLDTAINCRDHVFEFYNEYPSAVINNSEQYYSISKRDSFLSGEEYLDFCDKVGLDYSFFYPTFLHKDAVDICFRADEKIFDIKKLYSIILNRLKSMSIQINFGIEVDDKILDSYDYVIISTYTNNNKFLDDYPESKINYQYELCEKPVVRLPNEFQSKGVVIMDGPFMCLDPYGDTGLHVLGNVVHAIHQTNIGTEPGPLIDKRFERMLNNGIIENPPISNFPQFISSASQFFYGIEKAEHIGSMFTYRVVFPNLDETDERPTVVQKIDNRIISLFSGKIPTCVAAANQVVHIIKGDQAENLHL